KDHAESLVVPLPSNADFNFEQYDQAEPLMIGRLRDSDRPIRQLGKPTGCANAGEFLTTVSALVDAALAGKTAPLAQCYVYDAQVNTLRLERLSPMRELSVRVNGAHGGALIA